MKVLELIYKVGQGVKGLFLKIKGSCLNIFITLHCMADEFLISQTVLKQQSLTIDRARHHIRINVNMFAFVDSQTSQFILYIPSLELSSYGETEEKAIEMLKLVFKEFREYVGNLQPKELFSEFNKLGWVQGYKRSTFSHAYVDKSGVLGGFNVPLGEVRECALSL